MAQKPNLSFKAIVSKPTPQSTGFSKAKTTVKICFSDGTPTSDNRVIEESAVETLLNSLAQTPVVGIYNPEKNDFEGHYSKSGYPKERFGYVPETSEPYFETDNNGQTWLCSDVIIWTNYQGANKIFGANQSMEIDENTYEGGWQEDSDGNLFFVFTRAEFKALCVLGRDVQPAYTGSGFAEPNDGDFAVVPQNINQKGVYGLNLEFKKSFAEQQNEIVLAAMETFKDWNASVIEMFDDSFIAYSYETGQYYRVPYNKNEDSISFGEKIQVKYYAVSSEEENEIDQLREQVKQFALDKSNWEVVESELKESKEKQREDFETQIEILKTEHATKMAEATEKFEALESEKDTLVKSFEELALEHKKSILAKYDIFEEAEVESLLATPMAEFKAALGIMLVDKNAGTVAAKQDFGALIPAISKTDADLPDWAKAVKSKKEEQ